jgi:MFS family permease
MVLFWASFMTLIAAGMGFAVRTDILLNWGHDFGFTQSELGELTGMGLAGFGVAIIFFSFFADLVGYGKLMIVAFLLHAGAIATTLAASYVYNAGGPNAQKSAYWCLFLGQLAFSLGNGTCEAVINPLTASLFPRQKTHWLNILHAGWPGGLILGALVSLGLNSLGVGWEVKWGIVMIPVVLYGVMMLGRGFPTSEAKSSGISIGTMFATLFAPLLLFLFLLHAMVGFVELGTDSWITNITNIVLENKDKALLAFIWTNVLMFTLRFFAGPIVHKISPLGLLFCSAVLGTLGLILLGLDGTRTTALWLAAVTVYGIGKTFYWPTLLGVVSERFPKGGALALGVSGGIGMLSAGLLGAPGIGYMQDYAATRYLEEKYPTTLARYQAEEAKAPFPFLPKVAGPDNGKVGVLENYAVIHKKEQVAAEQEKTLSKEETTLNIEKDIERLKDKPVQDLIDRLNWWKTTGRPKYAIDVVSVQQAQLHGGKTALTWTACVPAALALGFLILIIIFRAQGGYQAQVLLEHKADDEEFTGGTVGPAEG